MLGNILNKYKCMPIQIKASFWFLICAFFQRGISVITTPIFTRLLSSSEYGQYSVFISWMDILTVVVSFKLYAGVFLQGVVKFEEDRKCFEAALQGLCLSLVLGWGSVYLIFRDFFNDIFSLSTIQMVAMLSMIWTTAVFSFWSVEQRTDNKYKKLVAVSMLVSLAKPSIGVILVLTQDDKVTARIVGLAAVELIVYMWFFFSDIIKGKTFFHKRYWRYALRFNIPLIPHYLSMSILNSVDRIMINNMVGESAAGIYSLAYSISMIMTLFNTALLQTIEPWLYKKIKAKKVYDIGKVAYTTLILIASVNIMLIAFAPEAVKIFAPVEYQDAIWVIPAVAMSVYFMFAYSLFAVFEFYYEKTKYITLATIVGAIVNIILNYIFIDVHGYYAAGYTTLLCYMIFAIMHYGFMRKICKEKLNGEQPYSLKILLTITIVFLCIGFVCLLTYSNDVIRYIFIGVICIGVFIKRKLLRGIIKSIINLNKVR